MPKNSTTSNTACRRLQIVATCFLAVSAILILLPIITVPSTPLYLFKADNPSVELFGGFPEVSFGAFGYCVDIILSSNSNVGPYPRSCSSILFGYDSSYLEYSGPAGHETFSISHYIRTGSSSIFGIYTRLMILYPVALAAIVLALISSAWPRGPRHHGRAAIGSILSFLCVVLVVAFDFAALALVEDDYIKHPINGNREGRVSLGAGPIATTIALGLLFMSSVWNSIFYCINRTQSKRQGETFVGSSRSSEDFGKLDGAL